MPGEPMNSLFFSFKILRVLRGVLCGICLAALIVVSSAPLSAQTTKAEWRPHSPLPEALGMHRAVLLHTGEVLVCGGLNTAGAASTASYLYSQGAWRQSNNQLRTARFDHALVAVRKANGESLVFAIGGYTGNRNAYNSIASVEVLSYNAAQKSWSWQAIGNLPAAVGGCAAAADKKGSIIVSGGRVVNNAAIASGTPSLLSARIDIGSLSVQRIGDLATARSEHAVLMLNGPRGDSTVLSACGENSGLPATEILNASAWDARANPPAMQHSRACNVSDKAEVARMIGGFDATGVATNRGEWYDTKSGWRAMPRMQTARARATMCLVAGLRDTTPNYLIVAGQSTPAFTNSCEIFSLPGGGNPNGAWAPFSSLGLAAADRCVTINQDNLPLVSGGNNSSIAQSSTINSCEIYQPLNANDLNFGQEELGRESARTVVSFRNTWLLPVMLTNLRIPGTAEFRLTNARDSIVIAPGSSIDIDVRFRPGSIGPTSAVLLANIGSLVDTVKLQGEGIKSSISIMNKSIDFGARPLTNDSTICFSAIRNDGKDTTVIDSIVVNPSSQFTVLSPLGRTRVAPDSVLIVCVKYHPTLWQQVSASTEIHISDRTYPIAVLGQGIRRFLRTTSQLSCDTVSIAPGDSLRYDLILSNTSDLSVHVDSTIIKSALAGTFRLAQPSPFPLDLSPGSTRTITIVFEPQREALEQGTVQFINNGDTLCTASLCFVPRNRSVNVNIPQSAALRLCEGDSITIPVILENPGNFDVLRVDSVYVRNMKASITGFSPLNLKPRENTSIDLTLVPLNSGTQQANLVIQTNQGLSQSSISLNVLPAMKFSVDNASSSIGEQVLLRVRRSDLINTVNQTTLELQYNGSVLSPLQLLNAPSKNYLDLAQSTITKSFGSSVLKLQWNSHPTANDEVFDILCEVLRGDDYSTSVRLLSNGQSSVCIQSAAATVQLSPECGGRSALINGRNAVALMMFPTPAQEQITVRVISSDYSDLEVRFVSLDGQVLQHRKAEANTTLDCSQHPNGVYACQVLHQGQVILSQPITLLH